MGSKCSRGVEIKHGRICMLPAMGYITPEITGQSPGCIDRSLKLQFAGIPNGLAAVSQVPGLGWAQLLSYMAFCDINAGYASDPALREHQLNVELANGRLAMVAILGMMLQSGTAGTTVPELRRCASACGNELSVEPPIGFWGPAGHG